jgi:TPR repeat protein
MNYIKKFCILLLLMTSEGYPQYLKDIAPDEEKLIPTSNWHPFRRHRENIHQQDLMRHINIEPEVEFMADLNRTLDMLGEQNHMALFEGDIPFNEETRMIIGRYFRLGDSRVDQVRIKTCFDDAWLEMHKRRAGRDVTRLVENIETAAEAGYVPAILAYGVMNRYGLFGMRKNIPMADVFFRIATHNGSGAALGYLAQMRAEHYVLHEGLAESILYGDDRLPQMLQLRAAAIHGGNMAYDTASQYQDISKNDIGRKRAKAVGKGALQVVDGTLDRLESLTESAGKIAAIAL